MTQGKSFRERTANCSMGTLGLPRASEPSKCERESIYLLQMSREGICWGAQGFQEQRPTLWIPISARRKESVRQVIRHLWASCSQAKHRAVKHQTLLPYRPGTPDPRQWSGSLPHSAHCTLLSTGHTPVISWGKWGNPGASSYWVSAHQRQPAHFHAFVSSFNKYLLVSYYIPGPLRL